MFAQLAAAMHCPSLVLIAQAIFVSEHGHTETQTQKKSQMPLIIPSHALATAGMG